MIPSIENITSKRKSRSVSSFLKKTYDLLNDVENQSIAKWATNGIGFIVISQEQFAKTILPKYFKHSNYSSFVRQLNMYNFHKIRETNSESYFHHEHFDRDNKCALAEIKRKPEKKKRKMMGDSDSEDCEKDDVSKNQNNKQNGELKKTKPKGSDHFSSSKMVSQEFQSLKLIQKNKDAQNPSSLRSTKQLFPSQFTLKYQNNLEDGGVRKSEINIWNENEVQDDKLSINNEIQERIVPFPTKELMYPSKHNLFPFGGKETDNFNFFY